jgi:hypothetical protein
LNKEKRLEKIIEILNRSPKPISGSNLADMFEVTRQVIVKDIAILKAAGKDIKSNSRGYYISTKNRIIRTIAVKHTFEEIGSELLTIVENGGKVLDVSVEHPIYGEITATLDVEDKMDVDFFLKKINNAKPLSSLNYGIHLHKIEVDDEEQYKKIITELNKKGFLL